MRAVWEHIKGLLRDPERLLTQFEEFACSASDKSAEDAAEQKKFDGHLKRLSREESRLVDAYQVRIIELQERQAKIAQRRKALTAHYDQQAQLRRQAAQAREMLEDLKTFCGRINARLDDATFEEKQSILQLLIERIIVGEDTLEIRHVIPLDGPPRTSRGTLAPPEPGGSYQDRRNGSLQTPGGVAGYKPHPTEPSGDQRTQEGAPESAVLARTHVEAQHLPLAALRLHPYCYDHRDRGHTSVLASLEVSGVDPDVGVSAFERSVTEALALFIELFAQLGDSALGDARHPRAFTNSSTLRVETPWTQASWTTAESARSAFLRGSSSEGKYPPSRTLGTFNSTVPTLVSQERSR
jgi:hypothetical protein